MFFLTGVWEPHLDEDGMADHAERYERLAACAATAVGEVHTGARQVLSANEGDAATAFERMATGPSSIGAHLERLSSAALRTARAYQEGRRGGLAAQTAMVALAKQREQEWLSTTVLRGAVAGGAVIGRTRTDLLRLEGQGVALVRAAFAGLGLPSEFQLSGLETGARIDPAISSQWAGMTDAQRMETLQRIADDYADDNGIPRIQVQTGDLGDDRGRYRALPPALTLNEDWIDNPRVIATVVHEMQHRQQFEGTMRTPWNRGVKAGYDGDESDRWKRLMDPSVEDKGPDDPYEYRPIEVDARRAAREYVDNLSHEEFQEFVPASVVETPVVRDGGASVTFSPSAWKRGGDTMTEASDSFYRGAEPVVIARRLVWYSPSPIEEAALEGDRDCHDPWAALVAKATEGMSTLASRMVATGEDYAATEDDAMAATARFWRED